MPLANTIHLICLLNQSHRKILIKPQPDGTGVLGVASIQSDAASRRVGSTSRVTAFQLRDEVQSSFENPRRWWRVESQRQNLACGSHTQSVKCGIPLPASPIVVGKGHAVMCISGPIHEAQCGLGKQSFTKMIFNENYFGDAPSLSKQPQRIGGVVQHVHEHHRVEAIIGMRDMGSVKRPYRNARIWSHQNIDSFDRHIWSELHN
jgi:hypothetical protein